MEKRNEINKKLKRFFNYLKINLYEDFKFEDVRYKNVFISCLVLLIGMIFCAFWRPFLYIELALFLIFIVFNCKTAKIIYFGVLLFVFSYFFRDSIKMYDLSQYVFFAIIFILSIRYIYEIVKKKKRINWPVFLMFLLLFVYMSQPWKFDKFISFIELPICICLIYLSYIYRNELNIKEIIFVYVMALLGSCFIGGLQDYSMHMQMLLPNYETHNGIIRFHACGTTNILASELVIAISLIFYLIMQKKISVLSYVLVILLEYFLLLTYSKLGIISLFVIIIIGILICIFALKREKKSLLILIMFMIMVLVINCEKLLEIFERMTLNIEDNYLQVFAIPSMFCTIGLLTNKSLLSINSLTTGRAEIWIHYLKEMFSSLKVFFFGKGAYLENLKWGEYLEQGITPHNTFLYFFYQYGMFFLIIVGLFIFSLMYKKKITINKSGLLPAFVFILCMLMEDFTYYEFFVLIMIVGFCLFNLDYEKRDKKGFNNMKNLSETNQNFLVSLIVPVYNVQDYLPRCIDSILNQTYQNLEIILVDDGSPDECPKICDEYAKKDKRIKVIHKKNGGLSDARNIGIKNSTGKYLCFIDSDDVIDKDYVNLLYNAIEKNNCDISICKYQIFRDESKIKTREKEVVNEIVMNKRELMSQLFKRNNIHYVTACTKMYKKELFDGLEFDKGRLHEDEFIVHKVFDKCEQAAFLDIPLYFYYSRPGSITKCKTFNERNLDAYYAFESRLDYLKNTEYEEMARSQHLSNIISIYSTAKLRNANKDILRFLKEKYKKYYSLCKTKNLKQKIFNSMPNLCAFIIIVKNKLSGRY